MQCFDGTAANRRSCREKYEIKSPAWSGKTTEGQATPSDCHETAKIMPDEDFLSKTYHRCFMDIRLGPLTTVYLALTKGWAALCSFVGAVYVRESLSCFRPLLCVFKPLRPTSRPPKNVLPQVPSLLILDCFASRILRGAAPDRAVFFLFGLNIYIRREGSRPRAK
jgi:hypothetical protein